MLTRPLVTATLLLLTLTSCGPSRRDFSNRQPKPPTRPPPPPEFRDEPIDQSLRADAEREIEQAAQAPEGFLRAHALEAMRNLSITRDAPAAGTARGRAWRDFILAGLGDTAAVVRFAAAMAAGELRLAEAGEPLIALVNDPDPNVQVAARFGLHRLGDHRYSHYLEKTALDPRPAVRANTAMVLGLLEEPSALKVLRALRRDSSAAVRLQVAEAMWRLGDPEGLDPLIQGSLSRYPDDQMVSLLGLVGPRDRRVIQHVRSALVHHYPEVTLVAARAMGLLGPGQRQLYGDEGYAVAQRGANSNDPRQRMLAALAFGAIGRPDSQGILAKLLKDTDADVRLAAAQAILQLRPPQG